MSVTIYQPYTYLIGWSKQKKYYYGVRYAKNCRPGELMETYFTSSKYVDETIKDQGMPDIIQIRKIFADRESACNWENKVLKRMRVVYRDDFINKTDNCAIVSKKKYDRSINFKEYIDSIKGKTLEEIYGKDKADHITTKRKEGWLKAYNEGRMNFKKSKESRKNYSNGAHERWKNPEQRRLIQEKQTEIWNKRTDEEKQKITANGANAVRGGRWMNKNNKQKIVKKQEIDEYLKADWSFGRLF
jgi:hypothetical protein